MQFLLVLTVFALATVNAAPTPGLISFRDWEKVKEQEKIGDQSNAGQKCVVQLGFGGDAEIIDTCAIGFKCKADTGYNKDKLDRGRFYWTGVCVSKDNIAAEKDAKAKATPPGKKST
jgi:hypothetical protein